MSKLRIERPVWFKWDDKAGDTTDWLNMWFDKYVQPINELLAGGQTVYSEQAKLPWHNVEHSLCSHTALLINVQPIVKWECPCGNKAMFADTEDCTTPLCPKCAYEIVKAMEQDR